MDLAPILLICSQTLGTANQTTFNYHKHLQWYGHYGHGHRLNFNLLTNRQHFVKDPAVLTCNCQCNYIVTDIAVQYSALQCITIHSTVKYSLVQYIFGAIILQINGLGSRENFFCHR